MIPIHGRRRLFRVEVPAPPIDGNTKGRIAALRFVRRVAPERRVLRLLDFLEHLEDALRRADEKSLVSLAEAATLESISAGSGSFGHGRSPLSLGWSEAPGPRHRNGEDCKPNRDGDSGSPSA